MVEIVSSRQGAITMPKEDSKDRFTKSGYGIRDLKAENHWREDLENFKIDKPTIFCLGGNGTINTQKANGFCAITERLMGLKRNEGMTSYNDVNILGFYYGRDKEEDTVGEFSKDELESLVDNLLLPLCVDDNGERLSLEDACRKFSLVTFATHCHGSREVNNMIKSLDKKLLLRGYTTNEIHEIFSHSFQMAYAPIQDESCVPTVRFVSMTDSQNYMLRRVYKDCYGVSLNGVDIRYDEPDKFRGRTAIFPHYDTISVYSSRLLNNVDYSATAVDKSANADLSSVQNSNNLSSNQRNIGNAPKVQKVLDEHTIEYVDRDDNWTLTDKSSNAPNAEAMSVLMGYALSWGVGKSLDLYFGGEMEFPKMTEENKANNKFVLTELNKDLSNILEGYSKKDLEMLNQ